MIRQPSDVRLLSKEQLNLLSDEIRELIIKTVAKNGGHLGSNLGVIELTIALHYVFDSPKDKIIWDVGHQSYTHKLLTGRYKRFETLRKYKGLSGFPKPSESVHDHFVTGHSSTSISAALGIAKARDLKGENHKVIAIIGDGALTGGEALEGLNNAGHLKSDLIVILNDNEMSISKNVGAISNYIHETIANPKYIRIRRKLEEILKKLPKGYNAAEKALEVEDTLRAVFSPGMMFKQMGFRYFGPLPGNDIGKVIYALRNIQNMRGPVLLHLKTKKGKGYHFAEQDNTKFHGIGSFNIENGERIGSGEETFTDAFSKTLINLAKDNEKIVAVTAAMATGTGLDRFAKEFPKRFFDVGIAEQHAVTFAAGMASSGFHPVVAIYSTFMQRAFDQVVHDVCLQNLPVTFILDRAGLVGDDGPTHHGAFDISFLRTAPNLVIMAPRNNIELSLMVKEALNHNGPTCIRFPRGCGSTKLVQGIQFGKSELLKEGKDIAIIAVGPVSELCLEAANETKSIDCAVINARFAKPIDRSTILDAAKKFGKLLIIEENSEIGGFGSAVLELLAENHINCHVERIAIPDRFIEHGNTDILKQKIGMDKENIKKKISILGKARRK